MKKPRAPKGYRLVTRGLVLCGDLILEVNGKWESAIDESQECRANEFRAVARRVPRPRGKGKRSKTRRGA